MKLYENDLFQRNKFKSILTIIIFIILIFFILRINLKHYFSKNKNSHITLLFESIINLDGTKIISFISSIFKEIAKDLTKVVFYEINSTMDHLVVLNNVLVKITSILNFSNLNFLNHFDGLKNSISNSVLPIFRGLFKIKNIFKKISGILATVLFTLLSSVMTSSALMGAFVQIITALLVMAIPFIILSFFFNLPFAIVLSALYVAVAIPMIMVAVETGKIYDLTSPSRNYKSSKLSSKAPHCFHKDTTIQTKCGIKKIKDLTINDYVKVNDNYVKITGLTKHCGKDEKFYNINGILVTGKHPIKYNNKWIYVCNHPNAKETNINEKYVYCLTTKEKIFQVKKEIFLDWDEFNEEAEKRTNIKKSDVDYFTSYLEENTLVKLNDNSLKKLKNIEIGDILCNNNKVVGKINLGNKQLYKYKINNLNVCGSRNLIYYDKNKIVCTLDIMTINSPFIGNCIQIFTENKQISLKNCLVGDYDTSLEYLIY